MMIASKNTAARRILPLLLAVVFLVLSLPESALAASYSAIVTADVMAVYADPYLNERVGSLARGEVVAVDKAKDGVAQFRYLATGSSGYASLSDLARVNDVSEAAQVTASGARFYRTASTSSQYKSISRGATVYVLSTSGDWAFVARNGLGGYMLLSALSIGQPQPQPTATSNALSGFSSANKDAIIVSDTLTVYETPSESAGVVGTLEKGVQVRVTHVNQDWAYITHQGKSGFAPLRYLLPNLPVTIETVSAVARGSAAVYETSMTSADRVATLSAGEEVTVIARNSTWACVRTGDGATGYVKLAAIVRKSQTTSTPAPSEAPSDDFETGEGVITETVPAIAVANTYVYKSASTASQKQGVLVAGTQVTVLRRSGSWAYITREGKYGFCNLNALQRYNASATVTPAPIENLLQGFTPTSRNGVVIKATSAYARPDTSSEATGSLSVGDAVSVTAVTSTWAYVQKDGSAAFVPLNCLLPDAKSTTAQGVVAIRNTNVYATSMTSATVLGTVKRGDVLTLLAHNGTWGYVRSSLGNEGFVNLSALTPYDQATTTPTATPSIPIEDGTPATVTTNTLAVYTTNSTSSQRLGTLSWGDQVVVLDHGNTWAYITQDGSKYGYCLLAGLTPTAQMTDGTPATVTADSLTVYRSASTSSQALGTLAKGEEVVVVDNNGEWAYILRNGNYGFCLLSGLTPTANLPTQGPDDSTVRYVATVVYPKAPFFQSASQSSAYVTVSAGMTVNVYLFDNDTGWAYVGIDSQRGYMLLKHLNKETYSTLSSGSSGDAVLTLQKALEAKGYFDGVPAGNYNTLTTTAVSRFQSAVGLSATGTADQTTQRILYGGYAPDSPLLSASLAKGSTGDNVTRLQTRLYYKGYLSKTSSVDGDFGSNTASAVKLFQKAAGLSETGTADSQTLRALYSNNAPKNPSGAADAGGSGGSSQETLPDDPTRDEKIEYVIYVAQQQMGKPYVYGATGPSKFDCSGLTTYCYKQVGVTFGRTAQAQGYNAGKKIDDLDDLQRGDIVCMNTVSDSDLCDHVGIYLGNRQMIHASSSAGKVIISSMAEGSYYCRVFSWGRRVL